MTVPVWLIILLAIFGIAILFVTYCLLEIIVAFIKAITRGAWR